MGDLVQEYERPAEADGWRPGQAGTLLLAGTRPEHITATLVDLAVRGHLTIDAADDAGWQLTRLPVRPGDLVRYEKVLLRAVFGHAKTSRLAELPKSRRKVIGRVHRLLTRDVVRQGAIRPHDGPVQATTDVRRLRTFRDQLRVAPMAWRSQPIYLPYAIAFGLGPQWVEHVQGAEFGWVRIGATSDSAVGNTRWIDEALALSWGVPGQDSGVGGHHAGGHDGGYHGDGHHGDGHHHGGW